MKNYIVVLDLELTELPEDNPETWNWRALLDLKAEERVRVVGIQDFKVPEDIPNGPKK